MNNSIFRSLSKPPIYTKSETAFWDDAYISKQMLKAHLDPDFDAASRTATFIEKSVAWIKELVPATNHPELLDIGCGPGIYAEKFTKEGYHVTGIDFSRRSIEYGKQSAKLHDMDITYIYENYLQMALQHQFDCATMIYCDYGALSTDDRQILMSKIYEHLKPGGKLLLDVFSMEKYDGFQDTTNWEHSKQEGFWREGEYIALNGYYKYPDSVTLDLITVITEDEITPYYIWNTYFSKESLAKEAEEAGFIVRGFYGDIAGKTWDCHSDTIAVLLEKR